MSEEPILYDPRWDTDIPGGLDEIGHMDFGSKNDGHPGILTLHGIIDLMHFVRDEVEEWEHRGEPDELPPGLRAVLAKSPAPIAVKADINPSSKLHTETFVIPAGNTGVGSGAVPVSMRGDRAKITLTNVGANPAFVSAYDDVNNINTAGETAWVKLANGADPTNPRIITSGGKIYVYSPLGTSVDILEEFGYRYQEEGTISL